MTLIILIVLAFVSLILAIAVERGANLSWLDGTAILITVLVVTRVPKSLAPLLFISFAFFF
jgi:hypothetical protein